jgi:ubiquitin C-terminal hydrolase
MTDDIRAKLEALISDSGMFNAGQQDERLRLCRLIDIRLDQLRQLASHAHVAARREELLSIRQALRDHT